MRELWGVQASQGLPLSITDKRMTRFWMTIDDAVDLVLLALERTGGGEVFIPKGVQCGRVVDLVRTWFPYAQIEETGKRSYEKITELLVSSEETDRLHDCGE